MKNHDSIMIYDAILWQPDKWINLIVSSFPHEIGFLMEGDE